MAAKRVFEVNEASFVDLKAELIRKETEFKREKLGAEQKTNREPKKPPVWAKVKKEKKIADSGAAPSKQDELSYEEQQALQKSRQALEAKAALYEKMARGEIEDENEDEEGGRFLVDFHKKIYAKGEESHQDSEELKDEDTPPPSGPEEEWVDYVDSLGRERRCLRKDLKHLQDMDKDMSTRKSPPTLLSEDMRRELMRQKWEKEEEEAMNKPVGPVHYQDIRFDEIRHLGVGYYQFSTSEEERQEQMKTLDKLREQTMEQRVRTQKLKDKRKAALDARLAKVRERKLKKLKASGELGEESIEGSVQSEEKEQKVLDDVGETTTEQGIEKKLLGRDEEEVSSRRPVSKTELPEWAQDKIKQPDKPRPSRADPRSERDQQFAPPSFYYEEKNTTNNTKNNWKESPKLFNKKNEISNKGQDLQSESRDITHQELQNEHKPQERRQSQQPLHSPAVPLPPGFPHLPPPPQEFVQQPWTGYQWRPPPNMPPPPPHQLPWQTNFPFNLPPPPSLWQPNIPPWQSYQGPPSMMTGPVSSAHAAWSGTTSNASTSLPGKDALSDGSTAKSADNSDANKELDQSKDRTALTTQDLASFVAQCRSST
ncbi:coiled-coil domain-containing protein 174-like isoform X2 [Oculina patagonica]